jgi:hypothetical protein
VARIVQWLTERGVIKEDQAARLKKVRAQLDGCLAKTPDVPEVIELLGSSGSYIDYSTCKKVLAALKDDATTVRRRTRPAQLSGRCARRARPARLLDANS